MTFRIISLFLATCLFLSVGACSNAVCTTKPSENAGETPAAESSPTTQPHATNCIATPSAKAISPGTSVHVDLEVTNVGSAVLSYGASGWALDSWTIKATLNGSDIGYSDVGLGIIRDHSEASWKRKKLAPGAQLKESLPISDLYDMSLPGTYHFALRRKLYSSIGEDSVPIHCSSDAEVIVTDKKN